MSLQRSGLARNPREAGFTLVEALVSLAVFGLAATMLLAGVGATGRSMSRLGGGTAAMDDVAAAQLLLRTRIERLVAAPRADGRSAPPEVRGAAGRISFHAPAPDSEQPIGLQRYDLRLSPGGELMLDSAHPLDDRASSQGGAGWRSTRLLTGVEGLSVAYFGGDGPGGPKRWRTDWTFPRAPDLVRVRVSFAGGDPRRWPDLVVRPGAVGGPACATSDADAECEPSA